MSNFSSNNLAPSPAVCPPLLVRGRVPASQSRSDAATDRFHLRRILLPTPPPLSDELYYRLILLSRDLNLPLEEVVLRENGGLKELQRCFRVRSGRRGS